MFNFLPTVSSAIGGFTPQRYVWRVCISLQAGLRFLLVFCYYKWHLRVEMGDQHHRYERLVLLAVSCHAIENFALVVLSAISSTDNAGTSVCNRCRCNAELVLCLVFHKFCMYWRYKIFIPHKDYELVLKSHNILKVSTVKLHD